MAGSINIPFSSVTFGEVKIENLGQHSNLLKNTDGKTVIVVGTKEIDFGLVKPELNLLLKNNLFLLVFEFSTSM